MCSSWSRAFMALGLMGSFVSHWFFVLWVVPFGSLVLSRLLHRPVWPQTGACAVDPKKTGRTFQPDPPSS
ncbi:hypothetical protein Sulac_2523 [Sulfobacillus acidophilus DSM 10332]|uniref:Uncharacterized protein n=1 Tax=Sulfobacillus acidophilus (strain ATCC 700253 / DSM 10332 / NAL) TaxID=679936 RepID=G8TW58_SULAD|nr:hypothetical protein Sulac_2523 [Sulfobacillus acidophilus DSM 10332]